MDAERLNKMDQASHLLPEPGSQVVGEMLEELRKMRSHLETAWGVIANAGVSLGDWNSLPPEWREAAEKWRDEWLRLTIPTKPILQVESWECRACDKRAPCRVEIVFDVANLPEYVKGLQRFRSMVCLCNESPKGGKPQWNRSVERGQDEDRDSENGQIRK